MSIKYLKVQSKPIQTWDKGEGRNIISSAIITQSSHLIAMWWFSLSNTSQGFTLHIYPLSKQLIFIICIIGSSAIMRYDFILFFKRHTSLHIALINTSTLLNPPLSPRCSLGALCFPVWGAWRQKEKAMHIVLYNRVTQSLLPTLPPCSFSISLECRL